MDTYLHAKLTVSEARVFDFVKSAGDLLATGFLASLGVKLHAAFSVREADMPADPIRRPYEPPPTAPQRTFINVWKVDDAINVRDVMLQSSEFEPYVALDSTVVDESQNIVYRVNAPATLDDATLYKKLTENARFALIRHYPYREFLASYAINSAALAPYWESQCAFRYGGSFQNITGLLNEFWELWLVDADTTVQNVRDTLRPLISGDTSVIGQDYRDSIQFNPDGPDDGVIIVEKAPYWVQPSPPAST